MEKLPQSVLIDRLCELVHAEHCNGCHQNTCDTAVAYRLGYALWAVETFAGSGATSEEFDRLYSQLGPGFRRRAEGERKLLCREEHVTCPHCNAVVWLPEECDYFCDSCARQLERPEVHA